MRFNSGFMKDKIITGMFSAHHNRHEDRRWRFIYGSAPGVHCFRQRWTSYKNSYDGNLDFKCGSNQALSGIASKHSNRREDRIWKFQCCILKPYLLHRERLTSHINSYDGILSFHCGANQVLVGLKSHHSNRKEDRLWQARCASLNTQVTVRGMPNTGGRSLEVQRSSYFFDKKIDDVFIIMTHNSLALPGKVFSPNQNRGLARQFRDGVRGFNLDLKANGDKMKSCHGKGWYAGGWWCHDPKDDIEGLMKELNRDVYDDSFIFVQLQSEIGTRHYHLLEKWFGSKLVKNFDKSQKLGYYMERGQQVLIFTDKDARPSQGIHDTNKFIVENQYEWKNRFSTPPMGYRRGPKSGTRIRLMNSFCSGSGGGDMGASRYVNNYGRALKHITEYIKQPYTGRKINVLMVDYYELGYVFDIQNKMRSLL